MSPYPGTHGAFCVRAYYRNVDSIVSAERFYCAEYHSRNVPSDESIRKWIRMFKNTGSTVRIQNTGHLWSIRGEKTTEEVRA